MLELEEDGTGLDAVDPEWRRALEEVFAKENPAATVIEITELEVEHDWGGSYLRGKSPDGRSYQFHLYSLTRFRWPPPRAAERTLERFLRPDGPSFPLEIGDRVLVRWQILQSRRQLVAVHLTAF